MPGSGLQSEKTVAGSDRWRVVRSIQFHGGFHPFNNSFLLSSMEAALGAFCTYLLRLRRRMKTDESRDTQVKCVLKSNMEFTTLLRLWPNFLPAKPQLAANFQLTVRR